MNKWIVILIAMLLIISLIVVLLIRSSSYQKAIEDSNFLKWSRELSIKDIELLELFSGFGQNELTYNLTSEDKIQLIKVFNNIVPDNLAFKDGYTGDVSSYEIYLYLRSYDGIEYLFKYISEDVLEIVLTTTVENADKFDKKHLILISEELHSFIKDRDPRKP